MNAPALGPGEGEQLPAGGYVGRLVVELAHRAAADEGLPELLLDLDLVEVLRDE